MEIHEDIPMGSFKFEEGKIEEIAPHSNSTLISSPSSSNNYICEQLNEDCSSPPTSLRTDENSPSFSVDPKNVYNVLILGETGVGKTTFVNGCANYLKYSSMEEALEKGPEFLMDISFTTTTKDLKPYKVQIAARTEHSKKFSQNESNAEGQSQTQDPIIHSILVTDNGVLKELRLIDTPGVNDTRGDAQDEKNFQKIQEFIESLGQLHAILILLKPNEARLTLGFRRCLDRLLSMIHSRTTENILFCFTSTRSHLYRPADTMQPLNEFLNKLRNERNIIIHANRFNIFCFDNACFRHMCEEYDGHIRNYGHSTTQEDWNKNASTWKRLLLKIEGMTPYALEDTTKLHKIKLTFKTEAEIVDVAKVILTERWQIEEDKEKYQESLKKTQDQINLLISQKLRHMKVYLDRFQMVCPSENCSDKVRLENGTEVRKAREVCYDYCPPPKKSLISWITYAIKVRTIFISLLQQSFQLLLPFQGVNYVSKAMEVNSYKSGYQSVEDGTQIRAPKKNGNCSKCNCSMDKHNIVNYRLEPLPLDNANPSLHTELRKLKADKEQFKRFVQTTEEKISELNSKYIPIIDAAAEFTCSIDHNSIVQEGNPFMEYLDDFKHKETVKANITGDYDVVRKLEIILKDYKERLSHVKGEVGKNTRSFCDFNELKSKVESIKKNKF